MTNVLVLAGGNSPEREVSVRSGTAVAAALHTARHNVTILDPAEESLSSYTYYDVVFPVLHGIGGEDGTIQAELESAQACFVGSDAAASRLCFNKIDYKNVLLHHGIPTPEFAMINRHSFQSNPLAAMPFVLKPYDGGSSVDTFIVRDPANADWPAMISALERYDSMLLEQLIDGVEITVGVLGDQALPVVEIIPPAGAEFDYENKYNGASRELCPPLHISPQMQLLAQSLALQIHRLTGCRDFSRTDMMVQADGRLQVLETNTIPGMTEQSLLPKAAGVGGFDMPQLCDRLVQFAADRAA